MKLTGPEWKRYRLRGNERAFNLGIKENGMGVMYPLWWIWGRLNVVPFVGEHWYKPGHPDHVWGLVIHRAFDQFDQGRRIV